MTKSIAGWLATSVLATLAAFNGPSCAQAAPAFHAGWESAVTASVVAKEVFEKQ
jgi:hypothetical protein